MNFDKFELIKDLVDIAINEDLKDGDPSSEIILKNNQSKYNLILKEDAVVSGIEVLKYVFNKVDENLTFDDFLVDSFHESCILGTICGDEKSILSAERTALNFIQRMSSVATSTYNLKNLINHPNVELIDTRKTIPGWRVLDKYSVLVGGGKNHRMNLGELIMIKDNHYDENNIKKIIENGKKRFPELNIEVEVENLSQLKEIINEKIDIVMLDNWSLNSVGKAIKFIRDNNPRLSIEISGGINEGNIAKYAQFAPDFISSGSITHSPKSIDLSLERI